MVSITLSPPHCQYLGLDPYNALGRAINFKFNYIRLALYWNRIEKEPNTYDFSDVIKLLNLCESKNQKTVVILGMKSVRYPEFHIPSFYTRTEANEKVLPFLKKTVNALQHYSCVTHWQIENEPLDISPGDLFLSPEELSKEVSLVRSLDTRPIVLTLWGNDYESRNFVPFLEKEADVIGFDFYFRQHTRDAEGKSVYREPPTPDAAIKKQIQSMKKPVWITELQAEPWEESNAAYRERETKSMSPQLLKQFIDRAKNLGASEIFLWGYEYWLWREKQFGDTSYLNLL